MRILGVNLSNNGSICLLDDGKIELYLEAERLSRKKRDFDCSKLIKLVKDVDKIAEQLEILKDKGFYSRSIKDFPECGTVSEVLKFHKLDFKSIAKFLKSKIDK